MREMSSRKKKKDSVWLLEKLFPKNRYQHQMGIFFQAGSLRDSRPNSVQLCSHLKYALQSKWIKFEDETRMSGEQLQNSTLSK